jgi:aspartate beta-hydroxylase/beta-hydroxylase
MKEGESILLDDRWNHDVYNRCAEDRVILIVDIRRPMPQPFDAVNRAAQAVMKRVYGRHVLGKLAGMTPPGPAESAAAASGHEAGRPLAGGA